MPFQRKWLHKTTETMETYGSWANMRYRCFDVANPQFAEYGGRGITICDRWADDYDAFYGDMGARPEGMTLDRIDNDGNYEPGNCRWATPAQQVRNTRRNRTGCFKDIARENNIGYSAFMHRKRVGTPLLAPVRQRKNSIRF